MWLSVLALAVWASSKAIHHERIEGCDYLYRLDNINEAIVDDVEVDWKHRQLCILSRKQTYRVMAAINFSPTECVEFPELNAQYSDYNSTDVLLRAEYFREQWCSGLDRNRQDLNKVSVAFALKEGLHIGGTVVQKNIYYLYIPSAVVFTAICFAIVLRLLEGSRTLFVDLQSTKTS